MTAPVERQPRQLRQAQGEGVAFIFGDLTHLISWGDYKVDEQRREKDLHTMRRSM